MARVASDRGTRQPPSNGGGGPGILGEGLPLDTDNRPQVSTSHTADPETRGPIDARPRALHGHVVLAGPVVGLVGRPSYRAVLPPGLGSGRLLPGIPIPVLGRTLILF